MLTCFIQVIEKNIRGLFQVGLFLCKTVVLQCFHRFFWKCGIPFSFRGGYTIPENILHSKRKVMKSIYREIIVKLSYPSRKSFALQRLRRFFAENVVYPSLCGDGSPYPRKNADFQFSSCRRALPPSDVHSSVCTKTQCLHQGEQMMSFTILQVQWTFVIITLVGN